MEKKVSVERLVTFLDNHVPMDETRAQTIMMQFPVFKQLFNESETDEAWLKSITMEQLEYAMISLQYASTEEDDESEISIQDHRNPAFEYVYARETDGNVHNLTPARVKPKFF